MAMLTTSDVCAIHTAIHSKPTAGWVTTASFGMLPLVKNSYGNGSVDLPGGLGACVGGTAPARARAADTRARSHVNTPDPFP